MICEIGYCLSRGVKRWIGGVLYTQTTQTSHNYYSRPKSKSQMKRARFGAKSAPKCADVIGWTRDTDREDVTPPEHCKRQCTLPRRFTTLPSNVVHSVYFISYLAYMGSDFYERSKTMT